MTPKEGGRRIRGGREGYRFVGRVPGDKSISHRAVLLAAAARGESRVEGLGPGRDVAATLALVRALGVAVEPLGEGAVRLFSPGLDALAEPEDVLQAENSGTTARLGLGLLAAAGRFAVVTGDASLRRRPMDRVAQPLAQLGAKLRGRQGDGRLPMAVLPAPLRGARVVLPVASAQVKSAVLLAAMNASGRTEVVEPQATRDHTERMLAAAGVGVQVAPADPEGAVAIALEGGQRPAPRGWRVPGDPSSAAFHLAAALLLGGRVHLEGVGTNPGRVGFLHLLARMGAPVRLSSSQEWDGEPVADWDLEAPQAGPLRAVQVGAAEVPAAVDELPLLGVLGAVAEGRTEVRGAAELRVKESDRVAVLVAGLQAFGVACGEYPDGFWVEGPARLRAAEVDPAGDHRLAMGLGLLALRAPGESVIRGGEAAAVSYPQFWEDLERGLGG